MSTPPRRNVWAGDLTDEVAVAVAQRAADQEPLHEALEQANRRLET